MINADSASGSLFLPFAISTRDLAERVKEALLEDHPEGLEEAGIKIPSLAWMEYQFAATNSGYKSSLAYSGKLQIKHKVQVRTLRQAHVDSHYCGALFKYVKSICLELAAAVHKLNPCMKIRFASMDDKSKVLPFCPRCPCLCFHLTC